MSIIGLKDYFLEVSQGNVTGQEAINKFGYNGSVANGSWSFVTVLGQTSFPLTSASTVRIKAGGNAADDTAGAGAREITVQGIVATTFAEETETITTAGASASSATTKSFWRVHRAWVSSAGTYEASNTGAIVVENSGGTTDIITIAAGEGQSQDALYTIPASKTGYLQSVYVTVDSSKTANVRLYTRGDIDDTSAPMKAKRLKRYWDGLQNADFVYKPKGAGISIPAKSDIWFEAFGDGAATAVSVDFEVLLIDD